MYISGITNDDVIRVRTHLAYNTGEFKKKVAAISIYGGKEATYLVDIQQQK